MSPRKTILRELDRLYAQAGDVRYTRPSALPGFQERPSKYQEAVNGLLSERLINGKTDDEGRMAIALNPHKLPTIRKHLRPWFARPAVWLGVSALAGLISALLLL